MKAKKLLFILFSAFALTSCDLTNAPSFSAGGGSSSEGEERIESSSSSSEQSVHEHTYSSTWSHDESKHWREATCGHEVKGEEGPHQYEDSVTEPTYESKGYTTHLCKICGYSYKDTETDAKKHNYDESWTHDEECHWHACLDEGYADLKANLTKHSFVSTVTAPTCTEDGYTTYTCECGYSYRDDEKTKTGHSFSKEWSYDENDHWHKSTCGHDVIDGKEKHSLKKEVTPPTYEKDGYTTFSCECGYSYTGETVSKSEHHYSSAYEHDETWHWHKCTDEGYEELKSGEAKHAFKAVTKEATCTEEGYTTYTCEECGYSYIDDKEEKRGHSYEEKWTFDKTSHWHETICGHEVKGNKAAHDYKEEVVSATFESKGYTVFTCKICDYSYQGNETPILTHNYSEEWKHDESFHWHECTDEGYEELINEKAEHSFSDWVIGAIGEEGKATKTRSCSVCNYAEEKTVNYAVSEEEWSNAFLGARNFTLYLSNDNHGMKHEQTMKSDNGLLWVSYTITYPSNETYAHQESITEITGEDGGDGSLAYYTYDETLDIWVLDSEIEITYEQLQKQGYDNFVDAYYDIEGLGPFSKLYASFSFDEESGTYSCSSLNYGMGGMEDVVVKFLDGKLIEVSWSYGEDMHYQVTDFGSTVIDESFRDKIHKHTFDESSWESDEYHHWRSVTCEHKDQLANRHYKEESHKFVDGVCATCGYKCTHPSSYLLESDDGYQCYRCDYTHTHDDVTEEPYVAYEENEEYCHAKKCPSCGKFVENTRKSHTFEDCKCIECGYIRHEFEYGYSKDEQHHWHEISCSHKDIENPTKEEHDYSVFGDVCSKCRYMNNEGVASSGEQIDEETWKKCIEGIDLNNLTMLGVRDSEYGSLKMKFDDECGELIKKSPYERDDVVHELWVYENGKGYRYYELTDGSYERREMFDGETVSSYGNVSYKKDILKKLGELPFSELVYDDESKTYGLKECSDYDLSDFKGLTIKFVDGSLGFVAVGYRSSDFAVFYDFGKTEINKPGECKTYTLVDGLYDYEQCCHYPVFECGDERKMFVDAYEKHTYEMNEDYEVICSKCGNECKHEYYSGDWWWCIYCGYYHIHSIDENGACPVFGEIDETKTKTDNLFILNFAYWEVNSFSMKITADYGDDGYPYEGTYYATPDHIKIEEGDSSKYLVRTGDCEWCAYWFEVDQETGDTVLKMEDDSYGYIFSDLLANYYYPLYIYSNDQSSSSEPVFSIDPDNENVYVYHYAPDYENADFMEKTIIVEFLPSGGVKSIKIVEEYFEFEEADGVTTRKTKEKRIIEIYAINETSVELPDFDTVA